MSETNGRTHTFPEPDKFSVRGREFELDVVEASTAFQEILSELGATGTQKAYLERVIAWVAEHGGPDLTFGEAEWFYHYVEQLREEKRAFFREGIAAKRTSQTSTQG